MSSESLEASIVPSSLAGSDSGWTTDVKTTNESVVHSSPGSQQGSLSENNNILSANVTSSASNLESQNNNGCSSETTVPVQQSNLVSSPCVANHAFSPSVNVTQQQLLQTVPKQCPVSKVCSQSGNFVQHQHNVGAGSRFVLQHCYTGSGSDPASACRRQSGSTVGGAASPGRVGKVTIDARTAVQQHVLQRKGADCATRLQQHPDSKNKMQNCNTQIPAASHMVMQPCNSACNTQVSLQYPCNANVAVDSPMLQKQLTSTQSVTKPVLTHTVNSLGGNFLPGQQFILSKEKVALLNAGRITAPQKSIVLPQQGTGYQSPLAASNIHATTKPRKTQTKSPPKRKSPGKNARKSANLQFGDNIQRAIDSTLSHSHGQHIPAGHSQPATLQHAGSMHRQHQIGPTHTAMQYQQGQQSVSQPSGCLSSSQHNTELGNAVRSIQQQVQQAGNMCQPEPLTDPSRGHVAAIPPSGTDTDKDMVVLKSVVQNVPLHQQTVQKQISTTEPGVTQICTVGGQSGSSLIATVTPPTIGGRGTVGQLYVVAHQPQVSVNLAAVASIPTNLTSTNAESAFSVGQNLNILASAQTEAGLLLPICNPSLALKTMASTTVMSSPLVNCSPGVVLQAPVPTKLTAQLTPQSKISPKFSQSPHYKPGPGLQGLLESPAVNQLIQPSSTPVVFQTPQLQSNSTVATAQNRLLLTDVANPSPLISCSSVSGTVPTGQCKAVRTATSTHKPSIISRHRTGVQSKVNTQTVLATTPSLPLSTLSSPTSQVVAATNISTPHSNRGRPRGEGFLQDPGARVRFMTVPGQRQTVHRPAAQQLQQLAQEQKQRQNPQREFHQQHRHQLDGQQQMKLITQQVMAKCDVHQQQPIVAEGLQEQPQQVVHESQDSFIDIPDTAKLVVGQVYNIQMPNNKGQCDAVWNGSKFAFLDSSGQSSAELEGDIQSTQGQPPGNSSSQELQPLQHTVTDQVPTDMRQQTTLRQPGAIQGLDRTQSFSFAGGDKKFVVNQLYHIQISPGVICEAVWDGNEMVTTPKVSATINACKGASPGQVKGGGGGNKRQAQTVKANATGMNNTGYFEPGFNNRKTMNLARPPLASVRQQQAKSNETNASSSTTDSSQDSCGPGASQGTNDEQEMAQSERPLKRPLQREPGKFAVCANCGSISADYNTCDGCNKELPNEVSYFWPTKMKKMKHDPEDQASSAEIAFSAQIVQEASSALNKKVFYGSKLKQCQETVMAIKHTPKVDTGGPRRKTGIQTRFQGKKFVKTTEKPATRKVGAKKKRGSQIETVTILSSDDEEGQKNDNSQPEPESPHVTQAQACLETTQVPLVQPALQEQQTAAQIPRRLKMEDQYGQVIPKPVKRTPAKPVDASIAVTEGSSAVFLPPRVVRIGSWRMLPCKDVSVSLDGVTLTVKDGESIEGCEVNLRIKPGDMMMIGAHFGNDIQVIFISTTPQFATCLRERCGLTNVQGPYFDPTGPDECHKRITIILNRPVLVEEARLFWTILKHAQVQHRDIPLPEANQLLITTTPNLKLYPTGFTLPGGQIIDKATLSSAMLANIMQGQVNGDEDDDTELPDRSRSPSPLRVFNAPIVKLFTFPPPPKTGGITVTNEDLFCLNEGEFLNDVIIDFYLKYLYLNLFKHDKERTHIFSSFFYRRLTSKQKKQANEASMTIQQRRHSRVRTWSRHTDLFAKDFIIVPINESAHWYLAIICFPGLRSPVYHQKPPAQPDTPAADPNTPGTPTTGPAPASIIQDTNDRSRQSTQEEDMDTSSATVSQQNHSQTSEESTSDLKTTYGIQKQPCILIFDSLAGPSRSGVIKILRDYLQVEWDVKKAEKHGPYVFDKDTMKGANPRCPQQTNFSDCGTYVLQYVESFFEDPVTDYSIPMKRLADWFPDEKILRKRNEIRELILSMQKELNPSLRYDPVKDGCTEAYAAANIQLTSAIIQQPVAVVEAVTSQNT